MLTGSFPSNELRGAGNQPTLLFAAIWSPRVIAMLAVGGLFSLIDVLCYAYVYAALNSTGGQSEAMALLERTHQRHPADREVLMALIAIAQSAGDVATAFRYAREMAALYPADPQFRKLVSDLEKRQGDQQALICCLSRAKWTASIRSGIGTNRNCSGTHGISGAGGIPAQLCPRSVPVPVTGAAER